MLSLKKYRKLSKYSQAKFARMTGVSQSTISHYEKGRRTPSIADARKVVSALNNLGVSCTLDDVFPDPKNNLNTSH